MSMRTFLPFLLTIMVVTAAPAAKSSLENHTTEEKHLMDCPQKDIMKHMHQLNEISEAITFLMSNLPNKTLEMWVPNVFLKNKCSMKAICKAGNELSKIKTSEHGLKKNEWILHRRIAAYTNGMNCSNAETGKENITLKRLLQSLHRCVQCCYVKPKST